ncbi:hypothetical protein GOBAR_AA26901 [Gossypium barbadense]|uniref:Uncharacterized protein n=1 Tax=Gossypium barbadense TaxID=3634 RepID=A0A2P5WRQ5_GOSBA|nr:hypothetical protein GOBAR_AA26901 [Gossypium barbadense]
MSLEELICHKKIKEVNHFKNKDPITANELSLKANLMESSSSPKFNRVKNVENPKKKTKPQSKKLVNFKKLGNIQKFNNLVSSYVCSKLGHKAYQCFYHSDHSKSHN